MVKNENATPEQKLAEISKEVTRIETEAEKKLTITSDEELTSAAGFVTEVKSRLDRVEELRLFFTKPLLDQKKKIDAMFKDQSAPLSGVLVKVKRAISDYTLKKEQEAREAERKLEEQREKKNARRAEKGQAPDLTPVPVIERQAPTTTVDTGKVTTIKTWKFEVTDEKLVPKKYLKVDESAIRAAVKAGEREIKGVRIYEDVETRVFGN